jgi:hypothetical protein
MSSEGSAENAGEGSGNEAYGSIEAAAGIANVDRPSVTLNC